MQPTPNAHSPVDFPPLGSWTDEASIQLFTAFVEVADAVFPPILLSNFHPRVHNDNYFGCT